MAYSSSGLHRIGGASGVNLWIYQTTDAIATVNNGGIQSVEISQAGVGYLENPEVEAVEDLPPWNDYSNGYKEEGNETGPGPGGESLFADGLDNEGMITGVGVKKAGNHFNKPTVYVRSKLNSVTNGRAAIAEADLYDSGFSFLHSESDCSNVLQYVLFSILGLNKFIQL